MKLLVTRPALDAGPLADLLTAAGHSVLLDPLLTIRFRDGAAPDLDGITGLLFTSGNGVRAFAAVSDRRDIAAFAVGDRTAAVAGEQGFARIESADGDVAALAALVAKYRRPDEGVLLHVTGSEVAGDLAQRLEQAGFTVRRATLYAAEPAKELAPETRAALTAGTVDGVLLFSPRTARQFAALMRLSALGAEALVAWCLSPAVADALGDLKLAQIHVADEPTQAALLRLVPSARSKEDFLTEPPVDPRIEPTFIPDPPPAPPRHRSRAKPLALAAAVIVIAAGGIALVTPQVKERLTAAGFIDGKPAPTTIAQSTPAVEAPPAQAQASAPVAAPDPTPPPAPEPAASAPATANAGGIAPTNPISAQSAPASPADSGVAARLDADESRMQAATDTVDGLQQRLKALEAKPAADPAAVQAMAADVQRLSASLGDATNRIAKLEAQVQQQATAQRNEKAAVLAVAELKDRLAGSGPFDGPVAVLKASAGDDPAAAPSLAILDKFAARGVTGRAVLAAQLDNLPAAINQPQAPSADAGLWQRIEARAQKLVTVRRIDDGSGGDKLPPGPDRSLAIAAAALKSGDLAGAVEAMKALDGRAGEIAKPWLDQAQDRLAVEQAVDRLSAAATQRLQAPPASDQGARP
ncbi:MAG TPA: uroporphyrinogen-III synthase [Aliidongia sp.]|uniref:uroporphyrinogen-III synthase n=1 Tax=Aliidongia sp. TaxID=1914230 RepID=UPI002DDCD5D3|nr:uroporphyrinogen-III synthase [Aliidongia sp.]HEV2677822.1 uroporphyrinogen-III synthase [Aliidongia sp.]